MKLFNYQTQFTYTAYNLTKIDNKHYIENPTRSEIEDYVDGGTHSWTSGSTFVTTSKTKTIAFGLGTQTGSNMYCEIKKTGGSPSLGTIVLKPVTGEPLNAYVIFAVGMKGSTPTYLEELAKLDQYSTAQYIPSIL